MAEDVATLHEEEAEVGAAPYEVGSGLEAFERYAGEKLRPEFESEGMEFDPTIIITILTTILPLILDCFKKGRNPTAATLRDRNNITAVALAIRKATPVRFVAAIRMARKLHEAADAATNAECKAFLDDCRCCA